MAKSSWLACPPCLMISASLSERKLHRAREMASRSAPAWLDRPPPLTVLSTSKRPSMSINWSGNISCSLCTQNRERINVRRRQHNHMQWRETFPECLNSWYVPINSHWHVPTLKIPRNFASLATWLGNFACYHILGERPDSAGAVGCERMRLLTRTLSTV